MFIFIYKKLYYKYTNNYGRFTVDFKPTAAEKG